ncbi:MAG: hypothetical protein Q8O31_02315, partial [Rhodocyclaceae bacterium]|nr:hypothetical protein [Rhodocyclaceae bacterium]
CRLGHSITHKSLAEAPPPSRGRLGGGWGKCDSIKFNQLQMSCKSYPIPTLTLPLKGRGLGLWRIALIYIVISTYG